MSEGHAGFKNPVQRDLPSSFFVGPLGREPLPFPIGFLMEKFRSAVLSETGRGRSLWTLTITYSQEPVRVTGKEGGSYDT